MTRFSLFSSLFSWLPRRVVPSGPTAPVASRAPRPRILSQNGFQPDPVIAWGAKVSATFKRKVIDIAGRLTMEPDHLMAIMAFETGRSFDPAVKNQAGSGATGLIQFMPATARGLGTTTDALSAMSAVEQLDYVERYLAPYAGRMGDLPSAYMAVLYPRAVSKEPGYVLFRKGSVAYRQNRGLDANGDGQVTKAEAARKVAMLLEEGLRPGRIG